MTSAFWRGKGVVVTGCVGFVGSHLVKVLVDTGAVVSGRDLVCDSRAWTALGLGDVPVYRGLKYIGGTEIIFHLAGAVDVHKCKDDPGRAFLANVQAAHDVLSSIRIDGQPTLKAAVFASSDRVYGNYAGAAMTEQYMLRPVDVYGATKAAADILVSQAALDGLPVANLRHVNAYGELDPHSNHLIPSAVSSALRWVSPVINSDGSPRKSYIHVDDVVRAYMILAEAVANKDARGSYNCASAMTYSVLEVADLVCKLTGGKVTPRVLNIDRSQNGYVECLNTDRLNNLGWEATIPLPAGLERVIEHHICGRH
jgi:nucleoside-diphosphate-sugar epimerase